MGGSREDKDEAPGDRRGVRMSDGSLRGKTEGPRRRYQVRRSSHALLGSFRANSTPAPLPSPRAVASNPVGDYKTVGRFLGRKEGTEPFVSPPLETVKRKRTTRSHETPSLGQGAHLQAGCWADEDKVAFGVHGEELP